MGPIPVIARTLTAAMALGFAACGGSGSPTAPPDPGPPDVTDLSFVAAVLVDPYLGQLVGALTEARRVILQGHLRSCLQASETGNAPLLRDCLEDARVAAGTPLDGVDGPLLAITDLFLAHAVELLTT